MDRRGVVLCLLELQRGLLEGTLGRAALLSELESLYGALGGDRGSLKAALPQGTQLAIQGEQGAAEAAQRKASAAAELRRRAERMVRYWIIRTGRDPRRTAVSDDRVRCVAKVLRHKADDEAMQAIANVADDPWWQGENDRGRRYDGIRQVFGKGIARFEELRDLADAPLEIDVELDETVGRRPKPKKALAELKAELANAAERAKRARAGGDRDAFNRWSKEERRLRRQVEQSARSAEAGGR